MSDMETLKKSGENHQDSQKENEPDHKLPLCVASEINRMRIRLEKMEENDIKVRPLSKALERLEEELEKSGYEIVDLKDKVYNDQMTVEAQFIHDESLDEGKQIITRIITPQVLFSGKLVQIPEIEVSIGS